MSKKNIKSESKLKQPASQEEPDLQSEDELLGEDEIAFNDFMQNFAIWFSHCGELKEIEIDGKPVPLYDWQGVTSRGKRVLLQLWRQHAAVFASFVE